MKCPHCEKELEFLSNTPWFNVETYREPKNAVTKCCGNIVRLSVMSVFSAKIPYNHDVITEDAWGNKKISK